MRKYVLRALSLYLDLIWVWTVVGICQYFVGDEIAGALGRAPTWIEEVSVAGLIAAALKLFNLSAGDWLLARAIREDEAGSTARQWPNLLVGTVLFLSGLKEIVRWTLPGDGQPFLFMVEETPLKIMAVATFGLLYIVGGVLVLRFAYGAKALNYALLGIGAIMTAINYLFYRDAIMQALVDRKLAQGLPITLEDAEAAVRMGY
ncbi:hypothetical protein BM885_005249, partial [Escherichia coli]|nr:hypothetical protein [Escherichia coli]